LRIPFVAASSFILLMLATACGPAKQSDAVFNSAVDTAVMETANAASALTPIPLGPTSTREADTPAPTIPVNSPVPTLTAEGVSPSATVASPTELPVSTLPPTLVPQVVFTLYRHSFSECGSERVSFIVINNGFAKFESAKVQIRDVTADNNIYGPVTDNHPFGDNPSSCPRDKGSESLAPGATAYLVIPMQDIKSGNQAAAYVTLCTQDDAKGSCVTRGAYFILPGN
jgi:hypothetical protein